MKYKYKEHQLFLALGVIKVWNVGVDICDHVCDCCCMVMIFFFSFCDGCIFLVCLWIKSSCSAFMLRLTYFITSLSHTAYLFSTIWHELFRVFNGSNFIADFFSMVLLLSYFLIGVTSIDRLAFLLSSRLLSSLMLLCISFICAFDLFLYSCFLAADSCFPYSRTKMSLLLHICASW